MLLYNDTLNKLDPYGLESDGDLDEAIKAMIDLMKRLKNIYDNMPDNPKKCIEPCTSASSLRAFCDCIWNALKKMKTNPVSARTDIVNCICMASTDEDCVKKWDKTVDDIFKTNNK